MYEKKASVYIVLVQGLFGKAVLDAEIRLLCSFFEDAQHNMAKHPAA